MHGNEMLLATANSTINSIIYYVHDLFCKWEWWLIVKKRQRKYMLFIRGLQEFIEWNQCGVISYEYLAILFYNKDANIGKKWSNSLRRQKKKTHWWYIICVSLVLSSVDGNIV